MKGLGRWTLDFKFKAKGVLSEGLVAGLRGLGAGFRVKE